MKHVVFACVHSAGRSQMAAAWFNALADPAKARASAAGTVPADRVHVIVVEAMNEVGIDLSAATPQLLTEALAANAAAVITMGCGESCPVLPPSVRREDWELPDPKGQPIERVREIRDEIRARVVRLITAEGWGS
jgi:arsenate reductase